MANARERLADAVREFRRHGTPLYSAAPAQVLASANAAQDLASAAEQLLADLATDTPGGDGT